MKGQATGTYEMTASDFDGTQKELLNQGNSSNKQPMISTGSTMMKVACYEANKVANFNEVANANSFESAEMRINQLKE